MNHDVVVTAPFAGDGSRPELSELAELADSLVDQIAATRSHYRELRSALDEAEPAMEDTPAAVVPVAPAEASEEPRDDEPDEEPDEAARLERARVEALNMALSGCSRADVTAYLGDMFGLDGEAEAIVDRAFDAVPGAPETDAKRRRFARLLRKR